MSEKVINVLPESVSVLQLEEVTVTPNQGLFSFLSRLPRRQWVWYACNLVFWAAVFIGMGGGNVKQKWFWFPVYAAFFLTFSPLANDNFTFFKGKLSEDSDKQLSSFGYLTCSSFVTWVFAKSIYNCAHLGGAYGIVGGLAYGSWYTAFTCVSVVVYRIRLKGYKSLPEAINHKYGPLACVSYFLAIVYRLYQEVWSNQIVVASFYGAWGEKSWWLATALAIIIPALYVLVGGMRASMVSDVWQCFFEVALLIGVLGGIGTIVHSNHWPNVFTWNPNPGVEMYSLKGGIDVLIVGLLQGGFSYGFFDPVLTDRAFLAEPKTMLRAYFVGGCIAALFIIFYSVVGIFGNMAYHLDPRARDFPKIDIGEASAVAAYLGPKAYAAVNILMLASSLSVLDSTMSSCAKLFGPEMYGFIANGRPTKLMDATQIHINIGRLGLIVIAIVGTLTLKGEQNAFNATSVSGTTIAGLGPPIIMLEFMQGYNPLAFHIPFWFGICMGIAFQIASSNPQWAVMNGFMVGNGDSSLLLGVNIFVIVVAFGLAYIFSFEYFLRTRDTEGFSQVSVTEMKAANEEKNEKTSDC